MGTRSLTQIYAGDTMLANMYRQMDGYPDGHGNDLAEFLDDFTMVNGICLAETRRIANGPGCLAAQIIAHFKDGPGGIYLEAPVEGSDCGQDYEYIVRCGNWCEPDAITIECRERHYDAKPEILFIGSPADFIREFVDKEY